MKEYIALFMFFIGFNSLVFSQEKNDSNTLTSSKWKIESIQIEEDLINLMEEDNWMVFNKNGSYEIYLGNDYKTGTWSLDEKKNLKFDLEDSNISQLSRNKFKFSITNFILELTRRETDI